MCVLGVGKEGKEARQTSPLQATRNIHLQAPLTGVLWPPHPRAIVIRKCRFYGSVGLEMGCRHPETCAKAYWGYTGLWKKKGVSSRGLGASHLFMMKMKGEQLYLGIRR